MPANFPVPNVESVRRIMSDVLGRDVTVVAGDALALEPDTHAVVATYATDDGDVAALCVTDLRLSNALGAALTMVSPDTVDDAVRQEVVNEQNLENLTEIVHVIAQLFASDDCAGLRWSGVHARPEDVPDAAGALLQAPLGRRDFDVLLDEYGSGKLAFFVG
jgi:hypothetical protein